MAKNSYIQIRISDEQKTNIQTNALKNNQTITDYIMSAVMAFEKMNLEKYGTPYGYGCPYQFARDYLIKSRQVLLLAIEALDNHIRSTDL